MFEGISLWNVVNAGLWILTAGIGWGALTQKTKNMQEHATKLEHEIDTLERKFDTHQRDSNNALQDISALKSDMSWIRTTMERIEKKIDAHH